MSQWSACDLRFLAKRLRTPRIEDSLYITGTGIRSKLAFLELPPSLTLQFHFRFSFPGLVGLED